MAPGHAAFVPPPITILTGEASQALPLDREGLTATAEKLRQKLASFGIQGQVTQIRPGPVVTMFEFLPAAGIKVSRIASLADDLAMAMEALRVRIVAPIPGKGVVGIEVPNKERQTVVLRELVEQDAFQKSHSKLAMCLGKDIEGMPYVADLAKMPHLLIAGTTGSGKSVAVNSMLVSMLLRATPEEVRFLMVDPKMLELSVYEGIPHLLLPVVTDAKKAALALRWAVEEMERRYQLLADCGVRNIGSFNKKVEKEGDAARRPHKPPRDKRVIEVGPSAPAQPELPLEPLKKLPYIVIIIDELADLMMVASREVETYIARLAQMARAAGIHLMVATQRPSTDVVTGVIKANFPSRISFQVASRHDSGTIINAAGAENLLGMGDMLILPPGTSTLTRVHGPYVDEKEIHAVVEHWKAQGAPVYDSNILRVRPEDMDAAALDDEGPDELYDQAVAALADMRFISISLLQRKLRVGYNRAARMIERMERDGIVGPADGAKPREVLVRPLGEMPGAGA
jgi:S-DNA-T family DNA segregation ATPase FtsK/SpoIIIE